MKFAIAINFVAVALALGKTVEAAECSKVYGQCGGVNYAGPTCCEQGSYCKASSNNKYYSQCLPGAKSSVSNKPASTTKKPASTIKKPSTTTKKPVTTVITSTQKPSPTSSSGYKPVSGGMSGSGKTTKYWDCCKASCSWDGKGSKTGPVDTCGKNGITLVDDSTKSSCDGGDGYMCNSNQPWAVNDDLAYGFAAASIAGSSENAWCCTCMELTFTNTAIAGKKMVVQVTNTGGDLGANHFDLQVPGGGVGLFNGCTAQWGAPADGWGLRYGGIQSLSECNSLPAPLQAGCKFRFGWFKNADNPLMTFKEVTCPSELVSRTGCSRV